MVGLGEAYAAVEERLLLPVSGGPGSCCIHKKKHENKQMSPKSPCRGPGLTGT